MVEVEVEVGSFLLSWSSMSESRIEFNIRDSKLARTLTSDESLSANRMNNKNSFDNASMIVKDKEEGEEGEEGEGDSACCADFKQASMQTSVDNLKNLSASFSVFKTLC